MAEVIATYTLDVDGVVVDIQIFGYRGKPSSYFIVLKEIKPGTFALLDRIKSRIIAQINLTPGEIIDPKQIYALKARFVERANALILQDLPGASPEVRRYLVGVLIQDMLGLGKVEILLGDENLEEIVINSATEPVRVYHRKFGWLETNIFVEPESQIQNYSNLIARRIGRQITTLTPLLDAHLITGDRANAVLYPISTRGNTITIRKFARDPWTMTDFINNNTCSSGIFALIWLSIQYEMNILISGGTGSGKTSMLNVCLPFVPPNQRIITVEDTRELQLPKFLYWTPLITRLPNPEGKGEITMLDLLTNSLRMRPDRIILGEVRKGRDAQVLFEAMHTGHSVYATIHADSINETIARLVNPPINVPPNLLETVNMNIVMFRDRRTGIRRTYQVGEFIIEEESGKSVLKPNILYRWQPSVDKLVPHSDSLRLFETLSRHTGLSLEEINKDLLDKKDILDYIAKRNIRTMEEIGKVMKEYYLNPSFVLDIVKKDEDSKKLLE